MRTFELYIPSIVCPACVSPIEAALRQCQNVQNVNVDVISKKATVTTLDDELNYESLLKNAIADIGHDCEECIELKPITTTFDHPDKEEYDIDRIAKQNKQENHAKKIIRNYWIKGIIGLLCGAAILATSIAGVAVPPIAMYVIGGISTALTLFLGRETYQHAITRFAKTRSLTMESLFTVSTLLALGVSCAAFFVPWLPMMFDVPLLILGFKNFGKAIEEMAKRRIVKTSFRSSAVKKVMRETAAGLVEETTVDKLFPGDIIYLYAGQTIPVNGICLTADTTIYNTIITGRTVPQNISENSPLLAGFRVPDDVEYIKIQVSTAEKNSYLALLDPRVEQAEREKAPLETSTTKLLQYFIPAVFGIAIISAAIIGFFISPEAAIECGITVLVSACPCAMGLITPLAIKTSITKAEKHGISFKSGKSVEEAAEIDTVVFDLNGTLTTGIPTVVHSTVPDDILAYVEKIEVQSAHPIAKAICEFIKQQKQDPIAIQNIKINKSHHAGMTAIINSETFVIGNRTLMQHHNINTEKFDIELANTNAEHIVYVAKNNIAVGYILLADPLREGAAETIQALRRQGKEIHLCTGADEQTAHKYTAQLNIPQTNIKANYVGSANNPENTKAGYIDSLMKRGRRVCMIGDAGNDTEAVTASDFGIAIQSNASHEVTQEKAGATINQNSLFAIANTFVIAKQAVTNIKQNLGVSIAYNLLAMILFGGLLIGLGFTVHPAIGAALMIVQTGLIFLNVERFRRQSVPSPKFLQLQQPMANDVYAKPHFQYRATPSLAAAKQDCCSLQTTFNSLLRPPPSLITGNLLQNTAANSSHTSLEIKTY